MLLWGTAHCIKYIIVMQMTIHAQEGLLRQLGVALPLLCHSNAAERHYRICCDSTDQIKHHTIVYIYKSILAQIYDRL
jgi:hypothetical protein